MEIAICDDDIGCCNQIRKWIENYKIKESIEINIDIFLDAETLIKKMQQNKRFDIIFLDIELPKINGVEFGRKIRNEINLDNVDISIVFISGKTKYCLELFELEPLNFHHKPLSESEIISDIEKIIKRKKVHKKILQYQEENIPKGIPLGKILFIEAKDKSLQISTINNEKIIIRGSITKLVEELSEYNFCQCHRSFLINLSYVTRYYAQKMYLLDDIEIPVGRKYIDNVKKCWAKYGEDLYC